MRCERCDGEGVIAEVVESTNAWWSAIEVVPCPRCHGSGIDHCCDGEARQPGEPSDKGD